MGMTETLSRNILPRLSTQTSARLSNPLFAASDYESDPFVNDRAYFSDTFKVAGQPVEGHQVLMPRSGPRPPTPRGAHMDVTTSFPDGAMGYGFSNVYGEERERWNPSTPEETTFRVGGRPVDGHQVLRPPPRRERRERGEHMRVTTSNPRFLRTDRTRRDGPLEDDYEGNQYDGPRSGSRRRYGDGPFRPNSQDLVGMGSMPMRDEEWDRFRNTRERPSRPRPTRAMDDFEEIPHFLTDDADVGLPVDVDVDENEFFDRDVPRRERMRSRREDRDFELVENDFNDVADREPLRDREWRGVRQEESIREKEWREFDERKMRRRPRPDRQDIQGLGNMPMRGQEWDDYRNPERRRPYERLGRRSYSNRETSGRRHIDGGVDYRRDYSIREESRPFYSEEQGYRSDDHRGVDDYDDDYVRDGPHMVRNRWRASPSREGDEDVRIRYRSRGRREEGSYYESNRDYDSSTPRRYFSRDDEVADRLYSGARRRDEQGSVGGPMPEELIGMDRRYSSTRPKWTAGTSFDTI